MVLGRLLLLAAVPLALAGCGGGSTAGASSAAASPTPWVVKDGCKTPAAYVFTDGRAHAEITKGSAPKPSFDVSGISDEQFNSSRPNNVYDPTAYYGDQWLEVEVGTAKGDAVFIEIEGRDPCAKSDTGEYAAVAFGPDDKQRFGGSSCDVTIDAFNDTGVRGTFNCMEVSQFGFEDNKPTIGVHGTFSAWGHVATPASPSGSASASETISASPSPSPSPS